MKYLTLAIVTTLAAVSTSSANLITVYYLKNPLLVQSASQNKDQTVLALLSLPNLDPNTRDSSGKTALHYAAQNGHLALTQALLLRGADPTIGDIHGETPRTLAKKANHDEIELLLSEWFTPVSQ